MRSRPDIAEVHAARKGSGIRRGLAAVSVLAIAGVVVWSGCGGGSDDSDQRKTDALANADHALHDADRALHDASAAVHAVQRVAGGGNTDLDLAARSVEAVDTVVEAVDPDIEHAQADAANGDFDGANAAMQSVDRAIETAERGIDTAHVLIKRHGEHASGAELQTTKLADRLFEEADRQVEDADQAIHEADDLLENAS